MPPARFQIARGSKATARFGLAIVALILGVPLAIALFALPHGPVTIVWTADALTIKGDPHGRTIPRKSLLLNEARSANLEVEPDLQATRRTDGIALPGYRSGWFDTAGAGKALLFVTDEAHAFLIPTTDGYALIVSPENPDFFQAELRRTQPQPDPQEFPLAPTNPDGTPSAGLLAFWLALLGLPALIATLLGALCLGTRRVTFEVTDDALKIRGDLFGRTIPRSTLLTDQARLVDLTSGPDKRTLWRLAGVGLPGYLSGWCRAFRRKDKYLAFLTQRSRVVEIPTTAGYTLLLSPAASDGFLGALRGERRGTVGGVQDTFGNQEESLT